MLSSQVGGRPRASEILCAFPAELANLLKEVPLSIAGQSSWSYGGRQVV